jgi:hypothetical protein
MVAAVRFSVPLEPTEGEVDFSDARFSIPSLFSNITLPQLLIEFILPELGNAVAEAIGEFLKEFEETEDSNYNLSPQSASPNTAETNDSDLGPVGVGDLSMSFDESRVTENTSSLFIGDTDGSGAMLFDISNPETVDLNGDELTLGDVDFLVSSEFIDFLQTQGLASTDYGGDVETDAIVNSVNADTLFT